MEKVLYHYTNIDKLALILKNKTIRFNSLNNMDDLQENLTADVKNFGMFVYVSCWTDDSKENIALWKQYTDHDCGIRIELPTNPFKKYNIFEALGGYNDSRVKIDSNVFSFFDLNDIKNGNWFTTNLCSQDLCKKIEYTDEIEKLVPQILKYDPLKDETNVGYNKVGVYKDLAWSYQKEYRYIFWIIPGNLFFGLNDGFRQIRMNLTEVCKGRCKQLFQYYDMKIDDEAFKRMKIVLSPTISPGNEILVKSVLHEYNPDAIIEESKFKGLIG